MPAAVRDLAPRPDAVKIHLRLSPWLYGQLQARATSDDSLQALIRRVLRDWLAAQQ